MSVPAFIRPLVALVVGVPAIATSGEFPVTYEDVSASHLPLGSVGGRSMDARPADVDDDGDLDLVVATEFGRNLLLINDGTGHFTDESAARMPQPIHDTEDIGVADLDGDGDLDIIFVAEDDQTNELYLNDGSGVFADASDRIPVTGTSNAVLVMMVNDDAHPDILIGNAGQNAVLINDGTAQFVDEAALRLPANLSTTQDIEAGDLDGDGDLDLIEGNETGNRVLRNDGTGVFTDVTATHLPLPPAGEETREADLGDVDGDGDLDLFLANVTFAAGRPSLNRLLLNDGDGVFTDVSATHLPAIAQNTVDGDLVDIDDDGDLDIVTAQAFDGTYQIFLNDGTGVFTDHTTDLFQTLPTGDGIDVEAADFTGDGRLDLYLTGYAQADYLFRGTSDAVSVPDQGAILGVPRSYPHPFRTNATITFALARSGAVTLRVLDAAGRVVDTLLDRELGSGSHHASWTPEDAASGWYFYQLVGESDRRTGRLLLIR